MVATHEDSQKRFHLRILLAEDSVLHQKLALALLNQCGCSVTVANNGKEAVEILGEQNVDLVLMDVEMPVMGGLEATGEIRERECKSGRHTPIIAVTGTADREKCLDAGMDGHIAKPLSADLLTETIGEVLGIGSSYTLHTA